MKTPQVKALEVLQNVGWSQPSDLSVEEIAFCHKVFVKDIPIKGSEGRILINGDSAVVSVDSNIKPEAKRRFVIAHELGHFFLHSNLSPLYVDTHKTLSEWYANGAHEQEANAFAAELLMPSKLFTEQVRGRKLNLQLIADVSSYFGTSLTATFLKYKDLGDFPVSIVYSQGGIIEWKQESADFPFKYIKNKSRVSGNTVAGDFHIGNGVEEVPVEIDAIDWFPEDHRLKAYGDAVVWEQAIPVSKNGVISCLWVE